MCLTPEEFGRMLRDEWNKVNKTVSGYHIHIYHDDNQMDKLNAHGIANTLKRMFGDDVRGIYDVGIVGPHVKPNVELDITRDSFAKIVSYLQMNNFGMSILVHPETGDDMKDHLQSSIWINHEVGYNQEFFSRLAAAQARQLPAPAPVPKAKI